jgi:hypothetical protein
MTAHRSTKLKVFAALVVIFVLGCVTGVALSGLTVKGVKIPGAAYQDPNAYYDSLRRELDLNAEQSAQIRNILEETRVEYRKICAEARPRYDALRDQARDRMRPLLTPSQQQRFDSIVLREDCSTCPDNRK